MVAIRVSVLPMYNGYFFFLIAILHITVFDILWATFLHAVRNIFLKHDWSGNRAGQGYILHCRFRGLGSTLIREWRNHQ